jgi:AmmeMemoRadiSam system protein B
MKKTITIGIIIAAAIFLAAAFVAFIPNKKILFPAEKPPLPVVYYGNQYSSPQEFMEGIYLADKLPTEKTSGAIRAVVIPHHLVAAEDTAAGISSLIGQNVRNIILLSPDHFNRCPTAFCTANADYETFFGHLRASPVVLRDLLTSPLVTNAPDLFKNEHGIYAVAPFIAHYLGDVPVTPLAVSVNNWKINEQAMLTLFQTEANNGSIFVVSSDFSHYLSLPEANKMDALTETAIKNKDLKAIADLNDPSQSDCPACLWLLASLAKQNGFYSPEFLMHTNSAVILKDLRAKETTSHFAILWKQSE